MVLNLFMYMYMHKALMYTDCTCVSAFYYSCMSLHTYSVYVHDEKAQEYFREL